jgi:hypothetical protein
MDTITKSMNLKWSIQNEKIQVLGRGGANNEPPILMNSSTGLINSPGKTKEGIEFESLLNPDLVPGRRVKLDSLFIKGMYVVSVVTHDGDSQKGPNSSKCEAFSYGK